MPGLWQLKSAEAALRRFPSERKKIELLMLNDSDFQDLCEDLEEAERALLAAEAMPMPVREKRTAEWAASIEQLTAEIARSLTKIA